MRTWRERIEDGAAKTDAYRNMMRGGSSSPRAIGYAVRCLAEDAADDLQRELDADCDPVALARRQAELSLLTAWLTFDSVLVPGMTPDEACEAIRGARKADRPELVHQARSRCCLSDELCRLLLNAP